MEIFANLIEIAARISYPARITIKNDRIADIRRLPHNTDGAMVTGQYKGIDQMAKASRLHAFGPVHDAFIHGPACDTILEA